MVGPEDLVFHKVERSKMPQAQIGKEEWEKKLDVIETNQNRRMLHGDLIHGRIIRDKDWSDEGFIRHCYNDYMQMAQSAQKSKISGKKIIEMTFPEYLRECKENLKWRMKKDLPEKRFLHREGGWGIGAGEYEKGKEVCLMALNAIDWYLNLPPGQRLILVGD